MVVVIATFPLSCLILEIIAISVYEHVLLIVVIFSSWLMGGLGNLSFDKT